jgi:hypothetical protein
MTVPAPTAEHPLGRRLSSEVDEVVAYARAGGPAKLDIARVAARLRIDVREEDLGRELLGLTLGSGGVLLHRRLRGAARAFVFAHEVAHVLRRRALFRSLPRSQEEWFADWFARELVLPRPLARRPVHHAKLAALHVTSETLALQLSAMGMAPPLMRNGSRVLCRACGTRQHRRDCECATCRRDVKKCWTLPDFRPWVRRYARAPDSGIDRQLTLDGGVLWLLAEARWAGPEENIERPLPAP